MASITASMFATGKYSDLLIKCKGKEFKVHRAVVCLQSKPLAAAIDGKFKEAITGEIDLDGNEPDIVQCMLQFLYTQDYEDGTVGNKAQATLRDSAHSHGTMTPQKWQIDFVAATTTSMDLAPDSSATLLIHAKVYIIGDQYDIQPLKKFAKTKYETAVPQSWNSASFVASLELLYKETSDKDRLLKDVAVRTAGQHAKDLCNRGEFVALCKANGEICFDIFRFSLAAPATPATPASGVRTYTAKGLRKNLTQRRLHIYDTPYRCNDCGHESDNGPN